MINHTGIPLVISAPSGGGKTTLCRLLTSRHQNVIYSVSYTTRAPRGQERDGHDYHFITPAAFEQLQRSSALLEWAQVHDHYYGTGRDVTLTKLEQGIDILFDIDIQGGQQISKSLTDSILVFILPPDMQTLEQRLKGRGSDSKEVIQKRLRVAQHEITDAEFYTYWIVNDELERAYRELEAILLSERLRRTNRDKIKERFWQSP